MNARFDLDARRANVRLGMWLLSATLLASACSPPPPRTFDYFLDDQIARDGVLARCDLDPVAAQTDIECANARRAATTIQLRLERERREELERESAAKIEALRRQFEAQQLAAQEAAEGEDREGVPEEASAAGRAAAGSEDIGESAPAEGSERADGAEESEPAVAPEPAA